MPLAAKDKEALFQAKTNVDAVRETHVSENAAIYHYQVAKNALDTVDVDKAEITELWEMITAFEDLAVVLDHLGEQMQEKVAKCRKRARDLR